MPVIKNCIGRNGGYNTPQSMSSIISYTIRPGKTERQEFAFVTGSFYADEITPSAVYDSFMQDKIKFNKLDGRQVFHTAISWHKDELDRNNPADKQTAFEYALEFAEKIHPNHQALVAIHSDKEHLHAHILWNSVSAFDGKKINERREDLYKKRDLNDKMSRRYGFKIIEKGKHFDGTDIEEGTIRVKNPEEQNLLNKQPERSFMLDLANAVVDAKTEATSKTQFIEKMDKYGWSVDWNDNRKNIVFINKETGTKVRNSTIGKKFTLNIEKEDLLNDFKANNQRQVNREQEKTESRDRQERFNKSNQRATDPNRGAASRKRRRRIRKDRIDDIDRETEKLDYGEDGTRKATEGVLQDANRYVEGKGRTAKLAEPEITEEEICHTVNRLYAQIEKDKGKVKVKKVQLYDTYSYNLFSLLVDAMEHSHTIIGFFKYLLKNFWRCTVPDNKDMYAFYPNTIPIMITTEDLTKKFHIDLSKKKIDEIVISEGKAKEETVKPYKNLLKTWKKIKPWEPSKGDNKTKDKSKDSRYDYDDIDR